ncbi:MAG: hypothetical protein PHX70_12995 [Clostridium sp.]|nr:hypothetical protein [Clostridium sp.]
MNPQYYFNSPYRNMPLSTQTPILPLEKNEEIFDGRQEEEKQEQEQLQRQQVNPPGSVDVPNSGAGSGDFGNPVDDINYLQGYLKTQIGKRVRVQLLVGSNSLQDRTGVLTEVGISFIILQDPTTKIRELCDMYSIKFVDIF